MTKVLTNSQGKIYINQDGKALAFESGDVIAATNTTGSAISNGDKVWIEPSGNNYNLINFRSALYNNFTVVGSPTVNTSTGVVSGFSSSNYLKLSQQFNPGNNTWEVGMKFSSKTFSFGHGLFGSTKAIYSDIYNYGIAVGIWDGKFDLTMSTDGEHADICNINGSLTLQIDTIYWVKFGWTGTEYYLDYSTDGTNYTRDITVPSSAPTYIFNEYTFFGIWAASTPFYLNGTIYLSECYITVNNSIWWNPRGIQIKENTLTGYAQENIASGSTGDVKTLLGD